MSRSLSDQASSSVQALISEARRVSLLPPDAVAQDVDGAIVLLREAASPRSLQITPTGTDVGDLDQLDNDRRRLRDQLQEIREEIAEVERISNEASEFATEVREQEARLASIGLLNHSHLPADRCPFCESRLEVPVPSVSEMRESLANLETQLSLVRRDAPRLQERLAGLETHRANTEEQLRTTQRQIADRIQANERLRIQQNDIAEQARVAGRIAYYLENVKTH